LNAGDGVELPEAGGAVPGSEFGELGENGIAEPGSTGGNSEPGKPNSGAPEPPAPIPREEEIEPGSLWMSSFGGRYHQVVKAHRMIQISTEIAVILVKISPAFTPNALAPPAPPNAPVNPPPRPRWSKMIKTMKSEIRNKAGPKTYWESIANGKNTTSIS
jgi:hypothetical protein